MKYAVLSLIGIMLNCFAHARDISGQDMNPYKEALLEVVVNTKFPKCHQEGTPTELAEWIKNASSLEVNTDGQQPSLVFKLGVSSNCSPLVKIYTNSDHTRVEHYRQECVSEVSHSVNTGNLVMPNLKSFTKEVVQYYRECWAE